MSENQAAAEPEAGAEPVTTMIDTTDRKLKVEIDEENKGNDEVEPIDPEKEKELEEEKQKRLLQEKIESFK